MNLKKRVENFYNDLNSVFSKHQMYIHCHAEFVSILKDKYGNRICSLYEECEPEYDEIESSEEVEKE